MGIDEGLISAYLRTRYEVWAPRFTIRIGEWHPALDAWLGGQCWAFITAWNPGSQPLPAEENRRRQSELEDALSKGGWRYFPGAGVPEKDDWQPEESLLVTGISLEDALEVGRRFSQHAILWGMPGQLAQIFFL
jgi:hypothetical protein